MPTESLRIPTPGGHELAGSIEIPTGFVSGAALFAHCFTCTKASKAAVAVSRALAQQGIACLRFDFTGLGGSEGEFGRAGFPGDVADLVTTARYLIERFGAGILLVGHSLGGAAVLAAAEEIDGVAAIATIGAPADVGHVVEQIEGDIAAIERDGHGTVSIGGRPFEISRSFLGRTRSADLLAEVGALRVPLLFLHSPTDQVVGIENAGKLFESAKHPKSFVSLHGADHLLLDKADADFAATMIGAWARRYLPPGEPHTAPSDGTVSRTGHGRFGTEVLAGSHRFVADEPRAVGGDDTGPTPYDLLGAALGTCTAMTIKLYAERKGWPLTGAAVAVTHERNHAEDLEHAGTTASEGKVQALHRTIKLEGDLDDDQRAKLMEIADKCPVHRTLEGHLHIHTRGDG